MRAELVGRGLTEREADVLATKAGWCDGVARRYADVAQKHGFHKTRGFQIVQLAVWKLAQSHRVRALRPELVAELRRIAPKAWNAHVGDDLALADVALPQGVRRGPLLTLGIRTLEELRQCPDARLLSVPHLRRRTVQRLRRWLANAVEIRPRPPEARVLRPRRTRGLAG